MKKYALILLAFLLFACELDVADDDDEIIEVQRWAKFYNSNQLDIPVKILTREDDYLMLVNHLSNSSLVQISPKGQILETIDLNFDYYETIFNDMIISYNDFIYLVGYVRENIDSPKKGLIVKLNYYGLLLEEKIFYFGEDLNLNGIIQTNSSNFIAYGQKGAEEKEAFLITFNSFMQEIWTEDLDKDFFISAGIKDNEGNLIFCGIEANKGVLYKIDPYGNQIFYKKNEIFEDNYFYSIKTCNNDYLIGGKIADLSNFNSYVQKTNLLGDKIFDKTYTSSDNEECLSLLCPFGNEFYLLGNSSLGNYSQEVFLYMNDFFGEIIREKIYCENEKVSAADFERGLNYGFIILISIENPSDGGDIIIYKTDQYGAYDY